MPDETASADLDYNALMRQFFNRLPYKTEYIADSDGFQVAKRVPCDPPTVDGFCAKFDVPIEKLGAYITPETASLCLSQFKDIMVTNGNMGLYESGPWGLTMKNLARWAEKSETTATRIDVEIGLEEAERIMRFLAEKRLRGMPLVVEEIAVVINGEQ